MGTGLLRAGTLRFPRGHEAPVTQQPVRLAVVMDHPAQQFTRGLQLLDADPDVDARVYYWSVAQRYHDGGFGREIAWDVDLLGGYTSVEVPSSGSVLARMLRFTRRLHRDRPEVVICYGWASWIARAAIVYCVVARARLLMYGDSTWQHSSRGRRHLAQSAALRLVLRACCGAVATGTFNREFYIASGMKPSRIWPGVCPADTETFGRAGRENRSPAGAENPPGEGTGDAVTRPLRIGFAGKLISRKGPDVLLRAAALLPELPSWSVTLVGDGPLMADLEALAAELGVTGRVSFHGFANTTEMPKVLAGFDVVAVPSRLDMRVLVTIEAMAAGAVLVVSDATAVWGPGDLVQEGVTGLIHASGDPADLARQLSRLLENPELLAALRSHGARRAADFGPDAFARTMAAAARGCLRPAR
jgi:glycosyltransferase involved in cell wall biosynthesis